MRAFIVAVNYTDLLAITLPYNRHHFTEVNIITDCSSDQTLTELAVRHGCNLVRSDAFYRSGADFNKWLALEEGLDYFGRSGLICLLDADVLWPKKAWVDCPSGKLVSPLRHMCPDLPKEIPDESSWFCYPIHRNTSEWAGYTQVFHADDPVLGQAPWHQTDWKHAGGADSFFQQKWQPSDKVRPPWNCLHLGPAGMNWCGRATAMTDGTVPKDADSKISRLRGYMQKRRTSRSFISERIPADGK